MVCLLRDRKHLRKGATRHTFAEVLPWVRPQLAAPWQRGRVEKVPSGRMRVAREAHGRLPAFLLRIPTEIIERGAAVFGKVPTNSP